MHVNSRYPISHRFLLGGKRRACRELHIQAHVAIAAPRQGEIATPIYSLNHARSGSDRVTASTAPLCVRPRRSRVFPIVLWLSNDFHEVSRAVGPKWQGRKFFSSCLNRCRFDSVSKVSECPDHSRSAGSLGLFGYGGTAFLIANALVQNDPDQLTEAMRNGPDRFVVSETRHKTTIDNLEDAAFVFDGSIGRLIKNAGHLRVSLLRAFASVHAGALLFARTCSYPRDQILGGIEGRCPGPHLGNDLLRRVDP